MCNNYLIMRASAIADYVQRSGRIAQRRCFTRLRRMHGCEAMSSTVPSPLKNEIALSDSARLNESAPTDPVITARIEAIKQLAQGLSDRVAVMD